jgi:exopolysaccharide biosynthesis polyprenyl glycosylphosphotransferase
MRKRSELLFSLILVPIDFLALVAAFVAAYILRVKLEHRPVAHPIPAAEFLQSLLLLLPILIIIFALLGLYVQSNRRGQLQEVGKVFIAVSGGVMFMILLDFFQSSTLFPSKAIPIYAYGFGLLFVLTARLLVRGLQRWLFKFGVGVHHALLVGSGPLAQRIAQDLANVRSGYRLVGVIDQARGATRRLPGMAVYKSLEEALQFTQETPLDEIIQADSALSSDEILDLVTYATNHHLVYRFVPNQFGLYATNSTLGSLAGIPMIEIRLTPLDGWGRIIKRVFDVIGATIGLILLSPVFAVVAVAIKLRDPGPVFYRHRRLSRAGEEVFIYKFRSMQWQYNNSSKYRGKTPEQIFTLLKRPELAEEFRLRQKVQDDPRVSSVGRFLRRTSLDEFPQLINALRGDLSLVGPRPIVPVELERYGDQSASFLALKPGITGLWQISGRSDISYEERVKLDIYYVENWSLWLDIKILLKTIVVILQRKGAY